MPLSAPAIPQNQERLCFFGIGASLADCYRQLVLVVGREPDFFCDNAEEKWGRNIFGVPCLSPGELAAVAASTAVVVTVRRYEEIHRQLSAMGVKRIFLACFDRGYDLVADLKELVAQGPPGLPKSGASSVCGKWTLITGASRGIGRQIALAMARLGSNLVLHSRSTEHCAEVVSACSGLGVRVEAVTADLGDAGSVERMLDDLEVNHAPIDIVFNNAAVSLDCGCDPWNISSSDFVKHYLVNTVAPIRICYRLVPAMIGRGYGRVVNISSTIQKRPLEMAYACSKSALNKFVHDLAPTLEGTGVMMSLVCPGHVSSDMGGPNAPHGVESVVPGVLLGALMDAGVNGRWLVAQDFAGLDLEAAISKAKYYYSYQEVP